MSKLKEFAKGLTQGSRLMQGREKLSTEDVLGIELTLRDYEILGTDERSFPVVIFDEIPDKYYCGGKVLNEICRGIDANGLRPELLADGLRIMLGRKLTKEHRMCVIVKVLD